MKKPTIGFDKLNSIKPDAAETAYPTDQQIDAVAKRHGFESREPQQRLYKRPPEQDSITSLSMRASVPVANRFISYAKANRFTYAQALEDLLNKAGEN